MTGSFDLAPWRPYERVMQDYFRGNRNATIVVYDDFERDEAPIAYFFRGEADFSPVDRVAVEQCRGRVLDVGAGAGCHSLALQARGIEVVALEVMAGVARIARERGVQDVRPQSIFDFGEPGFDTILMMMNGIGISETLDGLGLLLDHARRLLRPGGQVLADSCDLRIWDAAGRPDGTQLYREDGRYVGELHIQLEYQGEKGPPFQQLYADPDTLTRIARTNGWMAEVIATADPAYLARLTPR